MTASSERPVLLHVLSGGLLCFAILQGFYFIYLSYHLPSMFEADISIRVQIFAKSLMCLYLVWACILLLRGKRAGVYLVELAVLFSLVSLIWNSFKSWYYISEMSLMPNTLGWIFQVAVVLIAIAGHALFLWCLRNEKAILYFDLEK